MNSDADTDESQDPDFSLNGEGEDVICLFVILETPSSAHLTFGSPVVSIWKRTGTLRRQRPEGGGTDTPLPNKVEIVVVAAVA